MAMFVSGSSTSTGSFGVVKGTKHAIFGSHPDMDDMWYRTLSLGGRPNSSTLATLGFDPGGTYKQGIDYNSGDGMLTTVWGPSLWHTLHIISFNYPVKPTKEERVHYYTFVMSLKNVLPCRYCRDNFITNIKNV